MSTAAELARAEAERAEVEAPNEPRPEPTTEPQPEPEPEPEPTEPQPEPLTPEQLEKRYKKAGQIAERYAKQLTDALGPEIMATLVPSPLDALPGFVQVDPHGQVEPSVKAQTLAFLSVEPPIEYKQDPETMTCKVCGGPGDLLTGASRKGNELRQCKGCGGLGFTDREGRSMSAAAVQAALAPVVGNGAVQPAPATHGMGDPEVDRLRSLGYTVLEPIHPS